MSKSLLSLAVALALLRGATHLPAAEPAAPVAPVAPPAADPSYHLSAGDTIVVAVYGEAELAATQTIGRGGEVRLPLIGEVVLAGQTVREAEHLLEATYIKRQFLKAPAVNIAVAAYFPREVSVLGAVRAPGTLVFPSDTTSLDIVEIITRCGGFLPISKADAVTITRRLPDGHDSVIVVDLENVISGRRKAGRGRADLAVFPGDRVWVPERLF